MTFEEYWRKVEKTNTLPNTAIHQIPMALSEEGKRNLMRCTPEEAALLLQDAINQINSGSVESIESILGRKLG
jgi:hypothetical protein